MKKLAEHKDNIRQLGEAEQYLFQVGASVNNCSLFQTGICVA